MDMISALQIIITIIITTIIIIIVVVVIIVILLLISMSKRAVGSKNMTEKEKRIIINYCWLIAQGPYAQVEVI